MVRQGFDYQHLIGIPIAELTRIWEILESQLQAEKDAQKKK